MHRRGFDAGRARYLKENAVCVALTGGNGGYWITPTGREIPGDDPIAAFRSLPESERRPKSVEPGAEDAGVAPPPPGMLVLREFMCEAERDSSGSVRPIPPECMCGTSNVDFVWMPESEWKALVPSSPTAGTSVPLPERFIDKLVRFHLVQYQSGICGGAFWEPQQVRSKKFTLTVTGSSGQEVHLTLKGAVTLEGDWMIPRSPFSFLGYLTYDQDRKVFSTFDIVALGDCEVRYSYEGHVPRKFTMAYAFELAGPKTAGYGTPPRAIFWNAWGFGNDDAHLREEHLRQYFGSADLKDYCRRPKGR